MLLALCKTHSGIYIYLDQFLNDYRMNFQRTRGLIFFHKIPRQTYQHTASPAVVLLHQNRDLLPSFSSSRLHLPCLASQKRLSSSQVNQVLHDQEGQIFTLDIDGHRAYLKYFSLSPDSVNLASTVVPPELGGKGVAKILADSAFSWAVDNKLKMKLSCWYLSGYLKRHPKEDVSALVI